MGLTQIISSIIVLPPLALTSGVLLLVAYLVARYLLDAHEIRAYPGPLASRLTHGWMGWSAFRGTINLDIHKAHQQYGPFVRIAPNHISIADPAAIQSIYGHGSNSMKSDFYDSGVHFGGTPSVFTTRSREDHARKRKIVAHIFAPKSVQSFEPIIRRHQLMFLKHWDDVAAAGAEGVSGSKGCCDWIARDGRAWFDCLPWLSYQGFDVISDLAFGAPFGMIDKVQDRAIMATSQKAAVASFDTKDVSFTVTEVPPVQLMRSRAEFASASAVWPLWFRRYLIHLPWYSPRFRAMENMATVAVTALSKRLAAPIFRHDLLSNFLSVKDEMRQPLTSRELAAEVSTILTAGSDTTTTTLCAITYNLAKHPRVRAKLQQELEEVLGKPNPNLCADDYSVDDSLAERIKNMKYLEATVYESLRLHSTVGMGLPRVVPEGGLDVMGKTFVPGTIVSIPSYTVHRNKMVFGEDADEFRPERWLQGDAGEMHKSFLAFSVGPRACLGRNLALLNITTLTAMIVHRYDFVLENPEAPLGTRDGFVRKISHCPIGIRRRGD